MTDLERRLRRIVWLVTILGAAAAFFGTLRGEEVYDDANNCFGHAVGALLSPVHTSGCSESYTVLVEARSAGGLPLVIFVIATLAYGWLLAQSPGRWAAVLWSLWTAVGLAIWFAATFKLDLFRHTVTLWPAQVTQTLIGAMLLLIFPITPIVAFASKRAAVDEPASARVVER